MIAVHSDVIEVQTYDSRIRRIAYKIHRIARWRLELDDLLQAGRLALLESAERWRSLEHRSQFWTFAFPAVRGAILDCMFKARRDIITALDDGLTDEYTHSREAAAGCRSHTTTTPPDAGARPDHLTELVEHLSALDSLDREILERFAAGEDFREIAAHTGVSRSTAHRRYTAAVEAIRACA